MGKATPAPCTMLFLTFGVGVFDHDVWSPTEPTLAGALSVMVRPGDLAIPRIHGDPWLLAPLLPIGGIALALALSRRRELTGAARIGSHGATLAGGSAFVLAARMPSGDEDGSYRSFFEEIRPELDGRELCTTLRDDLSLPLIDGYLERPIELLDSPSKAFEKLCGPAPVGHFLSSGDHQASKSALADLPHRVLRGCLEKQALVLVVNRRGAVRESRAHRRPSGS